MRARWFILVLLLGAAVLALADSKIRIVRISFLQHQVETSPPPAPGSSPASRKWGLALLNAPIVEAEGMRTAGGAAAEVQLECGSALRLAPNSEFIFTRLRLRDDGIRSTVVTVVHGTAFFSVRSSDSPDLSVDLPGGEIVTRQGAARFRVNAPVNATENATADVPATVELLDGHASVLVGKNQYPLKKSDELAFVRSGPPRDQPAPAPDPWQQWSHNRDQVFQSQVLANQPAPFGDASSSAMPTPIIPDFPSGIAVANNPTGAFNQIDVLSGMPTGDSLGSGHAKKVPYCAQ